MFTTKKSLFSTGRDGRDGTNGAKVGNYFFVTTQFDSNIRDTKYAIKHNLQDVEF